MEPPYSLDSIWFITGAAATTAASWMFENLMKSVLHFRYPCILYAVAAVAGFHRNFSEPA